MEDCIKIENIKALEVLDSRGNPTVQVTTYLNDGSYGRCIVPSGASTGSFEAVELRDNDKERYNGKGVKTAVNNVNEIIKNELVGKSPYNQKMIDDLLIKLDGTDNKAKLGANAMLGVSVSVAKAAAKSLQLPFYRYIGGISSNTMPIPMMNILNGGKHSDNTVNIQEFMIVPKSGKSFKDKMRTASEIYHELKNILKNRNLVTAVGDEGGFAPNLSNDEEALELLVEAIKNAGYTPGQEVGIALDIAATEMYEEAEKIEKEGSYLFWKTGEIKTSDEMVEYYTELVDKYPIISIEDGLAEEDWYGWEKLTSKLSYKILLVGDDLFVTNPKRLQKGIMKKIANSILIKPNQIGTLSETIEAINLAKRNNYTTIISHRSGETEDTTIADLAVALGCKYIKSGAPCRTDRVCKYNRLLNIEAENK
mgnify:CR=1 FL=1